MKPYIEEEWIDKAIENAVEIHISEIRPGDTILHTDGHVRTVCRTDIRRGFMGLTLFGDSYRLGTILVKKLLL